MKRNYTNDFYQKRKQLAQNSAKIILRILYAKLQPASIIDLGCGSGTWLAECQRLGSSEILGVDGPWVARDLLEIEPTRFIEHDFESAQFRPKRKYDLAICIEVAEHLQPKMGDLLVESATKASDIVLFSAAVRGQGGTGHINEQPQHYWASRFYSFGYICIDMIRPQIWDSDDVNIIYKQNMLVYMHKVICDDIDLKNVIINRNYDIDRIHPDLIKYLSPKEIYNPFKKLQIAAKLFIKNIMLRNKNWK